MDSEKQFIKDYPVYDLRSNFKIYDLSKSDLNFSSNSFILTLCNVTVTIVIRIILLQLCTVHIVQCTYTVTWLIARTVCTCET